VTKTESKISAGAVAGATDLARFLFRSAPQTALPSKPSFLIQQWWGPCLQYKSSRAGKGGYYRKFIAVQPHWNSWRHCL